MIERITSSQNPKIKQVMHLKDRKDRDRTGLFIIEGFRELSRATKTRQKIKQVFFSEELFLGNNEDALLQQLRNNGAVLYACTESVLRKISYRDRPDGLIAIAQQMDTSFHRFARDFRSAHPFLLIAEAIEKPGNLGTILRSCDAVHVDAAIICDRCTDVFNPNVVRASVGTLFTQPVIEASAEELIPWLQQKGIYVVAATPHATQLYTQTDLTGPVALVVGTEQLGLTKQWLDTANIQVRIPMKGEADSLNVATATTLLLYEVLRQREGMYGCDL